MIRYTVLSIAPGSLVLAVTPAGVAEIALSARRGRPARAWARERHPEGRLDEAIEPKLQKDLLDYFAGQPVRFRARVDLSEGTPFQQQVLRACAKIPYGQTVTYGTLAQRVGRPRAARAIGNAMARNPVPILIPCHRVVPRNGGLGGFSAEQGTALKQWLLAMEAETVAASPRVGCRRARRVDSTSGRQRMSRSVPPTTEIR